MISCIICSCAPNLLTELKKNIVSTIGCECELVIIDNSNDEYSIFSAYNEGVRRAKGDFLCFMHEDIIYHSQKWGNTIISYFKQFPNAGVIGVAGTHFLSKLPSGWWETDITSRNLLQGNKYNGIYECSLDYVDVYKSNPTQVASVDGLWMCMPRDVLNKVKWDERRFNGFHGYDLDMSMQVWKAGYEVHVIWDILLEHKSLGNVKTNFYDIYDVLWKKWADSLPMVKGVSLSISEQEARTKIVELKKYIREQNELIEKILHSHAYCLGMRILKLVKRIKKLFNL